MQTRNKATGFKLSPLALLIGLGLQLPASAREAQQQKAEEETIERVMV